MLSLTTAPVSISGVEFASQLGLTLLSNPELSMVLGCAAVGLGCGVMMLLARRMLWGPPLRLVFLGSLLAPAVQCARLWLVTRLSVADLVNQESPWHFLAVAATSLLPAVDTYQISPGPGLYLWTAGMVSCLLGLLLPGSSYRHRLGDH